METIIKYLGVIGITLMVVEFATPIKWIKKYFKIDEDSKPKELYKQVLQGLFNCAMCSGFWIGLIFYQNLYWAVIISFSSELIYRLLQKVLL